MFPVDGKLLPWLGVIALDGVADGSCLAVDNSVGSVKIEEGSG
jgi:hypothetical protein